MHFVMSNKTHYSIFNIWSTGSIVQKSNNSRKKFDLFQNRIETISKFYILQKKEFIEIFGDGDYQFNCFTK